MTNPADNPCTCRACGALILNEVTSMCEDCEADMNAYYDERDGGPTIRLASGNANPDEEPEFLEAPDNDAFADACGQMTREDWDADNDWLASAGWGEM